VGVAIHIRDCLLIGVYDFIDDRAKWLKAAAMAFNLIYKTSEREEQQSPRSPAIQGRNGASASCGRLAAPRARPSNARDLSSFHLCQTRWAVHHPLSLFDKALKPNRIPILIPPKLLFFNEIAN
jgi:hypothetical protein